MASDDSVLIGLDQPIAIRVQAMPKHLNRLAVESDEVLVDTEFAEPITAAQKVLIVLGVKHVEHEIRWSVKHLVPNLALFPPSIVDPGNQAGNLRHLGSQLHPGQDADVPTRREQAISVDAQRQVRQERA